MIETVVKTASAEFNPIVMLGNPEHQHDPLANFSKRDWVHAIRISALDFPNVVADREVIPGGRSRQSVVRDLADADGRPDHPHYLSQVRGIAPAQSKRALIQWDWCELAATRFEDPAFRVGALALGVDPADAPTGDQSCISQWQGACCTEVTSFRAEDASVVAGIVHRIATDDEHPIDPRHIGVDPIGVGASTINELKRLGLRVRLLRGNLKPIPMLDEEGLWSATSTDDEGKVHAAGVKVVEAERYDNLRSQVLWRLREDLRLGRIALPFDKRLFEALTAFDYEESKIQIAVMSTDDVRVRLGRSPDDAMAVAYGNFVRRRRPLRDTTPAGPTPTRLKNQDLGLEKFMAREKKRQLVEERRMRRILGRRRIS